MALRPLLASLAPGLSSWDIRRLDGEIDQQVVLGAAAGFVLGTVLLSPLPLLTTLATRWVGPLAAEIGAVAYKIGAAYLTILLSVHWSQLDDG